MNKPTECSASIAAAQVRIKAVPAGETLIELIPVAEWLSPYADDWRIEAGQRKRAT